MIKCFNSFPFNIWWEFVQSIFKFQENWLNQSILFIFNFILQIQKLGSFFSFHHWTFILHRFHQLFSIQIKFIAIRSIFQVWPEGLQLKVQNSINFASNGNLDYLKQAILIWILSRISIISISYKFLRWKKLEEKRNQNVVDNWNSYSWKNDQNWKIQNFS